MSTPDQLDAFALGLRWVAAYGIAKAASQVTGKIQQGLSPQLRMLFDDSTLLIEKNEVAHPNFENLNSHRSAIMRDRKSGLAIQTGWVM